MRNTGRAPRPGHQDTKTGRFLPGNALGQGRPAGIPRAVLRLTYRSALEHACSPQDLLEITKRAVADAKRGDHYARMFIAKIMGLDSLRIIVDHPAGSPVPTYSLNSLSDEELVLLDQLSTKMITGPGPEES